MKGVGRLVSAGQPQITQDGAPLHGEEGRVIGRFQQPIDQLLAAVGRLVGQELASLLNRRQPAAKIDGHAAEERGVVDRRRRLHPQLPPFLNRQFVQLVERLEAGDFVQRPPMRQHGRNTATCPI